MRILMILTSHDALGDTGEKTGFWLEEFAAPYYVFKDAGADITLASPNGGQPPLDPKSELPDFQTAATDRFGDDLNAQSVLANTLELSAISVDDFDGVFYPGGHGPLWDLYANTHSIGLVEATLAAGKPLALVCHAPAVLLRAKSVDGEPLVAGRQVTGFSNSEEDAVSLTDVVPYLVEDELKRLGGKYSSVEDWQPHAVTDGMLVTGQNPASSEPAARALLQLLER